MLPKVRPCGQSISPQFPKQPFGRAQKTDKGRFQIATTMRSVLSDFPCSRYARCLRPSSKSPQKSAEHCLIASERQVTSRRVESVHSQFTFGRRTKSSSLSRGPSLCLYRGRALKSLNREIRSQFFRLCNRRASFKFHSILEDASILESHSASLRKRRTRPTDCSEKSLLRFAKPSRGAHRITPATVRLAQFENPPLECYKSDLRHALNFCCTWQNCRCAGKGFPDVARVSFPFRIRVRVCTCKPWTGKEPSLARLASAWRVPLPY